MGFIQVQKKEKQIDFDLKDFKRIEVDTDCNLEPYLLAKRIEKLQDQHLFTKVVDSIIKVLDFLYLAFSINYFI